MINVAEIKPQIMYCQELPHHKGGTYFTHFYPHLKAYGVCGDHPIHKVLVSVDGRNEEEGHWGWYDVQESRLMFIWPNKTCVNICFPYGPQVEEELGKGLRVPIKFEIITD